jgi:transmembrane sensor
MNERLDRARRLGQRIGAEWRREDLEAQLTRLHARLRSRALRRVLAGSLAAAATAIVVVVAAVSARREAVQPPVSTRETDDGPRQAEAPPAPLAPMAALEEPAPPSGVLSLGDGSVVTPLGNDSRLLARAVSETDVVVAVTGSGARFDVPDRRARRFRADLGALALETHGAAFRVRVTRRQIEVVAERGVVSARAGRTRQVVAAGETRTFPVAAPEGVPEGAPGDEPEDETDGVMNVTDGVMEGAPVDRGEREPVAPAPASSWRDDAHRGDYAAAWLAFERAGAPLDGMEDLLLAGDVARLSGHPAAAVAQLSRAVALHPADPRAPLAAFTLGRVHLEDLGAPREAAHAFARARELSPGGPLSEDALAREVEAWSRAGETEIARAQARSYLERYPRGRRAHAVRRFGGVEAP